MHIQSYSTGLMPKDNVILSFTVKVLSMVRERVRDLIVKFVFLLKFLKF
jgi:hypothetical protein